MLISRFSFIKNALQNTRLWIGLNDIENKGRWTWVDGRMAKDSEVFWLAGEPNNAGNRQDCGEIGFRGDYVTNDDNCNRVNSYGICEKRLY